MNEDEIFYPLKDWEESYEINKLGVIRSVERLSINSNGWHRVLKPKVRKIGLTTKGYKYVALSTKGVKPVKFSIHRLLAIQFIPNPNNYPIINHKNGDKLDNNLSNLEWTTYKYNIWHSYNILIRNVPLRKLNEQDVIFIFFNTKLKGINKNGLYTVTEMAKKYSVGVNVIYRILNKEKYLHFTNKLSR